jgi:hypothetical protein
MKLCPICKKHVKSMKTHKCREMTQSEKENAIMLKVQKMDIKVFQSNVGGVEH